MADDSTPTKSGPGFPPVEYRFRKGVSGNYAGRPLGSKNKKKRSAGLTRSEQITVDEAYRMVGEIPAIIALKRAQLRSAAKGSALAQRDAIEAIMAVERHERDEHMKLMMNAERYKQLCEEVLATDPALYSRHEHRLIPHPEDVEINWGIREVRILGPADRKERKVWLQGIEALRKMREMVFELRREVLADPHNADLQLMLTRCTHQFIENNDRLPERYRLRRIPIWTKGKSFPMPKLPDRPKRKLRHAVY